MSSSPPWLYTFLAAELFFLLVSSNDLKKLIKRAEQRTPSEQKTVTRGLSRSLLLECIVFVPASAVLLLLMAPLVTWKAPSGQEAAMHALFGVVSYGFPFAAVRKFVTNVALNTIKEFGDITHGDDDEDTRKK
jgi:hypothetical protein